jgi:glycosyltransferase involved in cell wall biosynthesis
MPDAPAADPASSPRHDGAAAARSDAALTVAVVGPTHPYKGGVAAHTTSLAHELSRAGHDVTLVSWSQLYPAALYPGEQVVPGGAPDLEPYPRTVRVLSWARPDTWVRTGRRLRDVDLVILVHVIPAVVPAHLAVVRAAGAGRRGGPRVVVVAHNVLPHEGHPGDRMLVRAILGHADGVVVHSGAQARVATSLGADRVRELDLPPHLPGGPPEPRPDYDGPLRLLSLGMVRDYKGVDLVLDALRDIPDVRLTIAGELWGQAGARVRELAADPRFDGRVEVQAGYVPADRIAALLARHDAVTLTYRSATASQNVLLAQRHGLPVLATAVGTFPEQVRDGIDGILVPPADREALVAALRRLAEPGAVAALAARVRPPDLSGPWARYVGGLEAMAAGPPSVAGSTRRSGVARRAVTRLSVAPRLRRQPVLSLRAADLPADVRPTDVLAADLDATAAVALARRLGLTRPAEPVAAWSALGALAAVVRVLDDRRRSAVFADASGPQSPFAQWARALGYAPIGFPPAGDPTRAADHPATLDVVTALHPRGCTASNVEDVVQRASTALRRGGLLILTVPIGDDDPEFAVRPAGVRGILARADDLGLVLVGDVDGDILDRMTRARRAADPSLAPAYAVLRLTFRRR